MTTEASGNNMLMYTILYNHQCIIILHMYNYVQAYTGIIYNFYTTNKIRAFCAHAITRVSNVVTLRQARDKRELTMGVAAVAKLATPQRYPACIAHKEITKYLVENSLSH